MSIRKMLRVKEIVKATAIMYKRDFSYIAYKIAGKWYEYTPQDVVDIATMGSTN